MARYGQTGTEQDPVEECCWWPMYHFGTTGIIKHVYRVNKKFLRNFHLNQHFSFPSPFEQFLDARLPLSLHTRQIMSAYNMIILWCMYISVSYTQDKSFQHA